MRMSGSVRDVSPDACRSPEATRHPGIGEPDKAPDRFDLVNDAGGDREDVRRRKIRTAHCASDQRLRQSIESLSRPRLFDVSGLAQPCGLRPEAWGLGDQFVQHARSGLMRVMLEEVDHVASGGVVLRIRQHRRAGPWS